MCLKWTYRSILICRGDNQLDQTEFPLITIQNSLSNSRTEAWIKRFYCFMHSFIDADTLSMCHYYRNNTEAGYTIDSIYDTVYIAILE